MKFLLLVTILLLAAHCKKPGKPLVKELLVETTQEADECEDEFKTRKGYRLKVNYEGRLYETDEVFDSSYERKEAFVFRLGDGQVIPGWEEVYFFIFRFTDYINFKK
jgi:FKBP-type peptidyl-prolyl cis-trans isomerase